MIKLISNENMNLTGMVSIADEETGVEKQVMYLNASLNADTLALNISVNVTDKTIYKANAEAMKAKYLEFKTNVQKRAGELGYLIF